MDATPFVGVIVVFGLLGLLLFVLKRGGFMSFRDTLMAKTSSTRELQLVERLSLTPAHSLHLVRAGRRTLLISVGPQSCQCIADMDARAEEGRL